MTSRTSLSLCDAANQCAAIVEIDAAELDADRRLAAADRGTRRIRDDGRELVFGVDNDSDVVGGYRSDIMNDAAGVVGNLQDALRPAGDGTVIDERDVRGVLAEVDAYSGEAEDRSVIFEARRCAVKVRRPPWRRRCARRRNWSPRRGRR